MDRDPVRNRRPVAWLKPAMGPLVLVLAVYWVSVNLLGRPAVPTRAAVGSAAPNFVLPALEGGAVGPETFRGRPLVINFFASWCDPCRGEASVVQAMAGEAEAGGYTVLGVAIQDERADLKRFMAEEGLAFPVALDTDGRVSRAFGVVGPPTTFFLDSLGVVRQTHVGPLTPDLVRGGLGQAAGEAAPDAAGLGRITLMTGILLALGAGLLSFLSPCCLPLLPAYMGYITGASADQLAHPRGRRRQMLIRTAAFALGLTGVFTALGASATLVGGLLSTHRVLLTSLGGLMVLAFGLHMMGLLPISLLDREFRPGLQQRGRGTLNAMVLGAVFAFGWTPCVGPMLGSILVVAGQADRWTTGVVLLAAYGLGLGIPFVVTGLAAERAMGAVAGLRRHVGLVKVVSGALLAGTGILLVSDKMNLIALWFQRILS